MKRLDLYFTHLLLVHCAMHNTLLWCEADGQHTLKHMWWLLHVYTTCPYSLCVQEQYIFVHDLMCDYVGSGDTSVAAHALEETVAKLTLPAVDDGIIGFEQQFGVRERAAWTGCLYWYPVNTYIIYCGTSYQLLVCVYCCWLALMLCRTVRHSDVDRRHLVLLVGLSKITYVH